jgi:carbon storage regulator
MIGDDVEITIVDVRGDKVRLGITAPRHIPVHRREIYDAIQREKAQKAEAEIAAGNNNEPTKKAEEAVHKEAEKPEKTSPK